MRDGKTNYFIFPGDTGTDASWLTGTNFKSSVTVTVPEAGGPLTAAAFTLVPHSHGPDGHKH